MFYSRFVEQRINRIHERILWFIYPDDSQSHFIELVKKGKSVTVHQKALQILSTEIFKAKHNTSLELLSELVLLESIILGVNQF